MSVMETRELLAKNKTSQVEICDKGILHVHSGAVTVHLSFKQAQDLATSLAIAMVKLTSEQHKCTSPILTLVHSTGENNG